MKDGGFLTLRTNNSWLKLTLFFAVIVNRDLSIEALKVKYAGLRNRAV